MKGPFVQVTITAPQVNLFWQNASFTPAEELFPYWMTAEIVLKSYVNILGEFEVHQAMGYLAVGPKQPLVPDLLTGELVLIWKTFPPEDQGLFLEIYEQCVEDFIPDLLSFKNEIVTPDLFFKVSHAIKAHHKSVHEAGGPTFKEWLGYRLGLACWTGL